jgi:hypothetical protein
MDNSHSKTGSVTDAGVSLLYPHQAIGWQGLVPQVILAGREVFDRPCRVTVIRDLIAPDHWVVRAKIENCGSAPVRLRRIRWTGTEGPALRFSAEWEPFYFATENLRGDFYDVGTTWGDRYFKPLPNETVELGWSEDQVFPGLFIGGRVEPCGLLVAAASQERFHLIYRLRGGDGVARWSFEIEELPAGVEDLELVPGETIYGEKIFFGITDTHDPQQATCHYDDVLRTARLYERRESDNPLPQQRIYCSWNYDFFEKITEADLFQQIPVLKKHFPSVRFLQLDDGYQRNYAHGHHAMIDFLYETSEPFDISKFPSGPRGLVERVKAEGFRPAIWLGLHAESNSPMIQAHPDWVLCDDGGRPMQTGRYCVLDPSVQGVRAYLEAVAKTVFDDWGFEGLKLDFSTHAFEGKRTRFRYPGKTALEWRRWLVDLFRRYLPVDGFFGWCVVAGTGNPLQAAGGADYFRCAIDIGEGTWDLVCKIASLCANTQMLMQGRPILPNIDSIGWSRNFTVTEWQTWLNLCAVTGAALEVSGDLTKLDEPKLQRLNHTLELSDPSRRVWCADISYDKVNYPPSLWVAQGEKDTLLAVFNWSDDPAAIIHSSSWLSQLLETNPTAWDAWTNEVSNILLSGVAIPPHGSILLRICERGRMTAEKTISILK